MHEHSIFIGYRRDDTGHAADRIYDRLVQAYGSTAIFMDVETMPVGQDFGAHIREVLSRCYAFLAVIGPSWVEHRGSDGQRSLDKPDDWVRIEIETALQAGLHVIPVLIDQTNMPRPRHLPSSLHALPSLNAARIRRGPDFSKDVEGLLDALNESARSKQVSEQAAREWERVRMGASIPELLTFIRTYPTSSHSSDASSLIAEIVEEARRNAAKSVAEWRDQSREIQFERGSEKTATLEDALFRANEASRAKSTFLANMSHELRTPINAVIGFSEIMAKELFGPLANPQYKQYSIDIFDSANHLLDLINDILDMAKLETGKYSLSARPFELAVAIEQAVRLTRRKAEEKNLSITVDSEDLGEIEADQRAVKQILLNLLSNAVKFTDRGGIMVHARGTATDVTLRVVDTGRGIAAEHLPRLARPFEQVERELASTSAGTGLGLALTKSLTEMHAGKLNIQSEVGRGTIVTVTLPRKFGGKS
ncbi:MAG: hypothetical protein A4S17_09475 [Proteobacteria bacterium HN_bin10]|nr:MAG: hypothetical protein A4S17_09475 [Proteobacteria bacterium HN_bin10]